MTGSANPPFPLGVTLTDFPDFTNPTAKADFTTDWKDFSNLMGTTPKFFNGFEDYTLPMSGWPGHAHWDASSMMQSSVGSKIALGQVEMVFAVPLYSTDANAGTPDSQFQAIAAGKEDSVYQGIMQSYAAAGIKNMVIRLGWEMNLPGTPYYVGDDAKSQSDWVKAFRHVYTVLHQEASALGVSVQVAWNPGMTNYSNAEATTNLYPGDNDVDIIAADVYSDMYPYNDSSGGSSPLYHDWATGGADTSLSQFIANPINRAHYWSYPAANEWSLDGSGGHSQSLSSLIQFAEQHNNPFAIPETGAGDATAGHDVQDDPTFPQWLSQQLTTAQGNGLKVDFVNIWDSRSMEFSEPGDGRPQEAAAWAKFFGVATQTPASGSDTLRLVVSEDAWKGDAEYTVSVDGKRVGGVLTASALHSTGVGDVVNLAGNWGTGSHDVQISFINDAYGGTSATDRNLYISSIAYDGATDSGTTAALYANSTDSFTVGAGTPTAPGPADILNLSLSEDQWNGPAKFVLSIDGKQVTTSQAVTTLHSTGAWEGFSFAGNLGAGSHTVGIRFVNDAWGGTPSTDRNLYVGSVTVNGTSCNSGVTALMANGTASFTFTTTH